MTLSSHSVDTPEAQGSEACAVLPGDLRCPEGGGAHLRATWRAHGAHSTVFLLHLHGSLCFQAEESFVLGEKPLFSFSEN